MSIAAPILALLFVTPNALPEVPFDMPPALRKSLIAAQRPLADIEACWPGHVSDPEHYPVDQRSDRVRQTRIDFEGIWGRAGDIHFAAPGRHDCRRSAIRAALKTSDAALDTGATLFRSTIAAAARGLWLGPLRLCGFSVRTAEIDLDPVLAEPSLHLVLTEAARSTLSAISRRAIGLPIAIRLDGSVITQPVAREEIRTGEVFLIVPTRATLEIARLRATAAC